jgi:hypothetical protein
MPEKFTRMVGNSQFWDTLSDAERHELFETSRLTGAALERYWRMSERQGPPPAVIEIQVSRRDVERLVRELEKKRRQK